MKLLAALVLPLLLGAQAIQPPRQQTCNIVCPAGATGPTGPAGPTGSTGATGAAGAAGSTGAAGAAGTNGNTVWNGTGAPSSGTGVNGDFYIDTAANKIYGPKASGAWPGSGVSLVGPPGSTGSTGATGAAGAAGSTGATGAAGAAGTNGNTVWNGTGAPSSGTGANGDFYIDTAANNIYGPKASGAWPGSGVSLVGPTGSTGSTGATGAAGAAGSTGATGAAGTNGNTVWNGTGAPSSGTGVNGDFYIDTAANKIYGPKASGAWPGSGVSLVGPPGSTGSTGATGAAGAAGSTGATGAAGAAGTNGNTVWNGTGAPSSGTGANGDFYIDTAANNIYGPKASGAWPGSGVSLVGPTGSTGSTGATGAAGAAGSTGATGAAGTNGNTVWNGTGAPSSGTGVNGDFYIDTAANKIYGPKASGAWPGSGVSLVGPAGSTGATGSTGAAGSTGATGPAGPAPSGTGVVNVVSGALGTPYALQGNSTTVQMASGSPVSASIAEYDSNGNVISSPCTIVSSGITCPGSFSSGTGSGAAGGWDLFYGTALTAVTGAVTISVPTTGTPYVFKVPAAAAAGVVTADSSGNLSFSHFPDTKVIPAANCNTGTAGASWSTATSNFTAACRAGSNNLGGALQAIPSTGAAAQFQIELPKDWDTATQPYINIFYSSGVNTSGTVIWTVSSACSKEDGSVSDDPAFNAESAFASQTMATANRTWAQNGQFTAITSGNSCIAGSQLIIKVAVSGTAASNINAYQAVVTIPRLIVVQAN